LTLVRARVRLLGLDCVWAEGRPPLSADRRSPPADGCTVAAGRRVAYDPRGLAVILYGRRDHGRRRSNPSADVDLACSARLSPVSLAPRSHRRGAAARSSTPPRRGWRPENARPLERHACAASLGAGGTERGRKGAGSRSALQRTDEPAAIRSTTHCAIANLTQGPDGSVGRSTAAPVARVESDAVYVLQSAPSHEITAGSADVARTGEGTCRAGGVPVEVLREFIQRRAADRAVARRQWRSAGRPTDRDARTRESRTRRDRSRGERTSGAHTGRARHDHPRTRLGHPRRPPSIPGSGRGPSSSRSASALPAPRADREGEHFRRATCCAPGSRACGRARRPPTWRP